MFLAGNDHLQTFSGPDSDVELGLLHPTSSTQDPPDNGTAYRHNLHGVIGDALEVFSKHLRAEH
jgi:hypothetical protein